MTDVRYAVCREGTGEHLGDLILPVLPPVGSAILVSKPDARDPLRVGSATDGRLVGYMFGPMIHPTLVISEPPPTKATS